MKAARRPNGSGQGRSQGSKGDFGQGRPSGQSHSAGQPINALTSKTVLRFCRLRNSIRRRSMWRVGAIYRFTGTGWVELERPASLQLSYRITLPAESALRPFRTWSDAGAERIGGDLTIRTFRREIGSLLYKHGWQWTSKPSSAPHGLPLRRFQLPYATSRGGKVSSAVVEFSITAIWTMVSK